MSFQNFHRWGPRNKAEIDAITRGDNYSGGGYWCVENGDTVWNETFEGTMAAVKNIGNKGELGTFTDNTMSVFGTSTSTTLASYYERYWLQFLNTGINGIAQAGGSDGEFSAGIAFNSPQGYPGAQDGDLMSMQHSGVAYVRFSGTFQLRGHVIAAGSTTLTEGRVENDGGGGSEGTMGVQVNDSIAGGAVTILMNFSEHL